MPSTIFDADPTGKSTGQNTKLFLIKVIKGTVVVEQGVLTHNLGFIPSWARVTSLSQDDQGTPVLNGRSCEPMLDVAASGAAGIVWFDNSGAINLINDIYIAVQNTNVTYDMWFEVEVGRTHSRSK